MKVAEESVTLEPIRAELPQGPFDLERRSACTAPVCKLEGIVPDPNFVRTARDASLAEGTIWLETIAEKSSLEIPFRTGLTALVLVLEGHLVFGEGTYIPKRGGDVPGLTPWSALRIPGAGFFLAATGGKASVVVALLADQGTLSDAIEAKKGPTAGTPKIASSRVELADLGAAEKRTSGNGAYVTRSVFENGPTLTLLQASSRGTSGEKPDERWDHFAVLRGSGELTFGGARYPVTPGAVFDVPSGVRRVWKGTGGEDLSAILVSRGPSH
jgi:mannose-6-phosphate isomerase-like protein (cupin superfamily)